MLQKRPVDEVYLSSTRAAGSSWVFDLPGSLLLHAACVACPVPVLVALLSSCVLEQVTGVVNS